MPKSRKRKITVKKKNKNWKYKSRSTIEPYEQIKFKPFAMPDFFGDASLEERLEVVKKLGEKGNSDFSETYHQLGNWFTEYDAPYLLAFCSVYFLSAPEGIDPEAIDGKLDFYQHNLEILQAIALTKKRSFLPKLLFNEETQKLIDISKSLENSIYFRQFYSEKPFDEKELNKRRAIAEIRGQTTAVRNAFYPQQTFQLARKLYSKISNIINDKFNLDADKIIDFFWKLMISTNDKLNNHLKKVRSFTIPKNLSPEKTWELYKTAFPSNENDEEMFSAFLELVKQDKTYFKYFLASYSDRLLPQVFCFSLDEAADLYGDKSKKEDLSVVLDLWSYCFGDLQAHNIEHFILDNPILQRPFIKLDDEVYFCPAISIINHSLLDLMELIISENSRKNDIEKYEKARADLLEEEVERLFQKYFPNAQLFKGSLWEDSSINKNGENDLLVLLDSFAFVVESKAGKINGAAKRGSILKLKRVLKDLVVKASDQANSFISYLDKNKGIHKLATRSGKFNNFDTSEVRYYVPLTITFESLGTVSANLRSCIEVGWIDAPLESLAPSLPVGDLETVFEILENEIERTHYLIRRSQIEKSINYAGDELDLLAFYLDNGFNLGDESKTPYINFGIKSKELDPYFVSKMLGKSVIKPKLSLSVWWKDIIELICKRKQRNWVEMGYVLLSFSKSAQKDFERNYKKLRQMIKRKKTEKPINFMLMITDPPQERSYAVVAYPYSETDKEERNNTLRRILVEEIDEKYSVQGIICFGISIENPSYPYNVSAYFPKNLLNH